MHTRRDLLLTGLAATLAGSPAIAAQGLPNLEVMVPSGPGGGWDVTAHAAGILGTSVTEKV